MRERNLPEKIADLLIAQIYTRELKSGDRLIPERQLADALGVDRTSLRMALRQLIRMNLLEARQGSGIRVLELEAEAGLDFLQAIFNIPELQLGADTLGKGIKFWSMLMPELLKHSLGQLDSSDISTLAGLVDQQKQASARNESLETLVDMEMVIQSVIIDKNPNEIIRLLSNSVQSLRRRLVVDLFTLGNAAEHFEFQENVMKRLGQEDANIGQLSEEYRAYFDQKIPQLLNHFKEQSVTPKILRSPITRKIYEPMLLSVSPRLKSAAS